MVKNGLTNIDPENYLEDKAKEMVKRFKEQGGSEEVAGVQEQLWRNGNQRTSKPWSDRQACQEHGKISGVQVKIQKRYGDNISEIRLRQGNTWLPWRRTSGEKGKGSAQEAFVLNENEAVVAVETNTDRDGWLFGMEMTTSTGRQFSWGDLKKDHPDGQKRRRVVENAKLGFCSGLAASDGYNDMAITFHWMMD